MSRSLLSADSRQVSGSAEGGRIALALVKAKCSDIKLAHKQNPELRWPCLLLAEAKKLQQVDFQWTPRLEVGAEFVDAAPSD